MLQYLGHLVVLIVFLLFQQYNLMQNNELKVHPILNILLEDSKMLGNPLYLY